MEGMNALGHKIPTDRKTAGYEAAKEIGIDDANTREALISSMVYHLEADRPFEAQATAMKYVDITAVYRLMAVLLTTPQHHSNICDN